MRPAYIEINLQAIADNVRHIKAVLGQQIGIIAVVKANGYGHGAVEVSRTVLKNGACMLAVAFIEEAMELREAGITAPVLVLGPMNAEGIETAVANDVTIAVNSLSEARCASAAGIRCGCKADVHIKVDSGMCRHGVRAFEMDDLCEGLGGLEGIAVAGIFTHYANSLSDPRFTLNQLAEFKQAVTIAEVALGYRIPLKHTANSGAVVRYPEAWLDAVRPGALIYGLPRNPYGSYMPTMTQALSLKAKVALVKHVDAGGQVGYDGAYTTTRPTRTALLPLGYADGYARALSNKGQVLIGGQRVAVIGRIAMDWTTVDVTDIAEVRVGDEAVLIGRQGENFISVEEVADRQDSIIQEVVARFSSRLPRVYVEH